MTKMRIKSLSASIRQQERDHSSAQLSHRVTEEEEGEQQQEETIIYTLFIRLLFHIFTSCWQCITAVFSYYLVIIIS